MEVGCLRHPGASNIDNQPVFSRSAGGRHFCWLLMSRAPATFVRQSHRKWFSFFFCKTILSVAWICAWFGSAGYFTILADYFKICGEHCNQLLDCFSVLHMSPHAGKGNKHLSHWINSGKREGRGGENYLDDELSLQIINTESSCSKHIQECLKWRAHGISVHVCKKLLTIRNADALCCY